MEAVLAVAMLGSLLIGFGGGVLWARHSKRHRHDWTKWKVEGIVRTRMDLGRPVQFSADVQARYCTTCNLRESIPLGG